MIFTIDNTLEMIFTIEMPWKLKKPTWTSSEFVNSVIFAKGNKKMRWN